MEITPSDNPQIVYTNMLDLADELPDNTPRFILLSYPLTLVRTNYTKKNPPHQYYLHTSYDITNS